MWQPARDFKDALMEGRFPVADRLLRKYPRLIRFRGYLWGETALHYIGTEGRVAAVRWLIRKGADPNARSRLKDLPLASAARVDSPAVVQALLEAGARTNMREDRRDTPLHVASRSGSLGSMRFLLKAGADPNAKGSMGNAPLHVLDEKIARKGVPLLVRFGADVDRPESYGHSPLCEACASGESRKVTALLRAGADIRLSDNSFDDKAVTPLHLAVWAGDAVSVRGLLAAGADPVARTKRGRLPGAWREHPVPREIQRMLARARQRRESS
jgi:ankyrin repeat protein